MLKKMEDSKADQVRGFYGIAMVLWIMMTSLSFPIKYVMHPIVLLSIFTGFLILFMNYSNVCDESISDTSWVRNSVPIYMGFAIITLFLTMYRFSNLQDTKVYRTILSYIVLSMIFFYIPITNICSANDSTTGLKAHFDNILVILSIGILIYLIAIASTFPLKIPAQQTKDNDIFHVMM